MVLLWVINNTVAIKISGTISNEERNTFLLSPEKSSLLLGPNVWKEWYLSRLTIEILPRKDFKYIGNCILIILHMCVVSSSGDARFDLKQKGS